MATEEMPVNMQTVRDFIAAGGTPNKIVQDFLLAEVDRLRAELATTQRTLAGYREQVRCLEAGADEW